MAQTLTCSAGHHWQTDVNSDGNAPYCPVCGEAATPLTEAYIDDRTPAPGVTVAASFGPQQTPPLGLPDVPGYEVLGELGRGGMSVVFKARHLKLNRIIALKMLTAGAHAGPDLLQRFRREGESFARLTHANIVQIHEVGWIDSYGPYLALEYAEGGSLAQKLARKPQPPRQAAAMVAVLARAVHFAHERGVLHRDLKPSNVLLTADGTPKVADFGLARFLQDEITSAPDRPTPTGAVLGTPGYMAPEQAGGVTRAPTAAMDVYALGAILYEMLTGRPPFLAEGPMETMMLALTEDPVPPRRLQTKTPRDLETICLHCLRKNPRQRYASAAALADDVQRFLDGKPIQVRPAGPMERLVKWARRRPTAAALLAVIALAVLVGLGLAGWYQVQLAKKNADLQSQKNKYADLVATAVDSMSDYGDFTDETVAALPESDRARRALLEQRLQFFSHFERLAADNAELRQRKARGLFEAARIHAKLGEAAAAEKEFQEAIALDEAVVAAAPEQQAPRHDLGRACIQFGILLGLQGRRDEAGRQYDRGIAELQKLIDGGAADPVIRRNLAEAYHALAVLRRNQERWPEALDAFGRAVDLCKESAADGDEDGRYKAQLAENYADRCGLYRVKGEPERGRADAALELFHQVSPDLLAGEAMQDALAGVHYHHGLLVASQDLSLALADLKTAWNIWDRLHRFHPDVPHYAFQAAEARSMMGRYCMEDKPEEAEEAFRQADALYAALGAASIDGADCGEARDRNMQYLASVLGDRGRDDEAERIYRDLVGRASAQALTFREFGNVLLRQGVHSLQRADVLAHVPAVGLTVVPNPLGAYQGYVGHVLSAQAEVWKAVAQFDEALEQQAEAGRRGQGRLPADLLEGVAQQRCKAILGLEQALVVNYNLAAASAADRNPAMWARVRTECLRAADARADLAAAWPTLMNADDAAHNYRKAATDVYYCIIIDRLFAELPADQKAAQERTDAGRVVQLLRQALAAGYNDAAELRRSPEATAILNSADPVLQKPRDDFRALLAELEKKAAP